MRTYIIGYYSEFRYSVFLFSDKCPGGEEIYNAGNSPYDSQITIKNGVGLEKMKEFCELTTKMLAIENNAEYKGIQLDEDTENLPNI